MPIDRWEDLVEQLAGARMSLGISPAVEFSLTLEVASSEGATDLKAILSELLEDAKTMWAGIKLAWMESSPPQLRDDRLQAAGIVDQAFQVISFASDGPEVTVSLAEFTTPEKLIDFVGGVVQNFQHGSLGGRGRREDRGSSLSQDKL